MDWKYLHGKISKNKNRCCFNLTFKRWLSIIGNKIKIIILHLTSLLDFKFTDNLVDNCSSAWSTFSIGRNSIHINGCNDYLVEQIIVRGFICKILIIIFTRVLKHKITKIKKSRRDIFFLKHQKHYENWFLFFSSNRWSLRVSFSIFALIPIK